MWFAFLRRFEGPSLTQDKDNSAETPRLHWRKSLTFRLFLLTIASILVVEALIFIPSATRFYNDWLQDQVEAGRLAALALEAAPSRMVSQELADDLLNSAMVLSVAEISDRREQILAPRIPIKGKRKMVTFKEQPGYTEVWDTLSTFFVSEKRYLVIRAEGSKPGRTIEVVADEAPLREAMFGYGFTILRLSLIISIVTGALIYAMLFYTFVRPMRRVTESIEQIRQDPGNWTRRLEITERADEIGRAQNALADMERAVSESFRQQERLALLGESVAKINHDLRNSLATAQLVSDGLSYSEDPRVARSLPRLERALERAINLASDTLKYGRSSSPEAELSEVNLLGVVQEAASEALASFENTSLSLQIPATERVVADPDHLYRICANLMRNAAEAMSGGGALVLQFEGNTLRFLDKGPGLPSKARENLFKPFAGSTRRDGTGLGLALSRDLARSMGGDLVLEETSETGTVFALRLASKVET